MDTFDHFHWVLVKLEKLFEPLSRVTIYVCLTSAVNNSQTTLVIALKAVSILTPLISIALDSMCSLEPYAVRVSRNDSKLYLCLHSVAFDSLAVK